MICEFNKSGNVIICDMDGTLLNENNEISTFSLGILEQVARNNIVIYASGRKLERIASKFPNQKILGNYVITQHGARTLDVKNNLKILDEHKLSREKFIEIYNLIRENGFDDEIVPDQNYDINWTVNNAPEYFYLMNIGKNYIYHRQITQLMQKVEGIEFFEMFDSNSDKIWGCVLADGVSKGNAISNLIKIENLGNRNIICFGDSINDVSMFEVANIRVAVKNAIQELKDLSNFVTDDNNSDGVAKWLKSNILQLSD